VVADRRQRPEDVLETTELTLLRVLTEAGGEAERHELERACLAAGMKPSSFNNRIAYSPIVTELGQGRYGLRGQRDATATDDPTGTWRATATAAHDASDATPRPGDLATFHSPRNR
jgi:hypothetical protein